VTASRQGAAGLQLWGGAECTVNRIGDTYRDQTRLSGHQDRPDDLDRFAALGIRKLRYPVLWERVAPDSPDRHDWAWSDERLARIRRLSMEPIVGLLHHGSGPRYTSLLDDHFPALLGDYARAVATRYPDVADWTPVNEPLTTARFSALYGHWYPHACDERSFWAALLNQIDGTRAAMRAIRAVNPAARLIQTEDLGRCYATDALTSVADFYNRRRWITWDLLAGRVDAAHPLWDEVARHGFGDRLRAIADDPCPADVIGVNHYVTSDRFLDDRGDGPFPPVGYHDVAAARVLDPSPPGLTDALRESWDRYGTPIAVTECHLDCTREDQLRWLSDAWRDCTTLRDEGVEVQALTAWALLGSTDWNSLLTRPVGHYETGAFDVRGGTPRPTAIASLLTAFGHGTARPAVIDAVVQGRGWWRRDVRIDRAPHGWDGLPDPATSTQGGAPLLIVGATGTLGRALAALCRMRGIGHVVADRDELPLDRPDRIAAALARHRPWAVVNAAGWAGVDAAEAAPAACHRANAAGAAALVEACAKAGIHCTLFSSDLVFDGSAAPYDEASRPAPLGTYGRSKAAAEAAAQASEGDVLVIRTAAFFSPHDPGNFAAAVERELRAGRAFPASREHVVSPTYVPDLVQACLDLVIDGATGVWHLTNGEALSWHGFARRVAAALALDESLVVAATPAELGWTAPRPSSGALISRHGVRLPPLDDAIARFAQVRRANLPAARDLAYA
jgi:dTDP-4-dehydrorhamnose reductase